MVANRIITDAQVRELRASFDGSNYRDLAQRYGISMSYTMAILYYRNRVAAGPPRDTVTYYISDGRDGRPKGLGSNSK